MLHEYVDMMDLGNLAFDAAIRHFLTGFRLPGEAQKIDRIMEKFAERFCLQNPAVFPSADTAFILSFSTIMLNTGACFGCPATRLPGALALEPILADLLATHTRTIHTHTCPSLHTHRPAQPVGARGPQDDQGGLYPQQPRHLLPGRVRALCGAPCALYALINIH